LKDKIGDKAEE